MLVLSMSQELCGHFIHSKLFLILVFRSLQVYIFLQMSKLGLYCQMLNAFFMFIWYKTLILEFFSKVTFSRMLNLQIGILMSILLATRELQSWKRHCMSPQSSWVSKIRIAISKFLFLWKFHGNEEMCLWCYGKQS